MGPRGLSRQVRKISPPPGFDPWVRPARSSVAIPTELHRPNNILYLDLIGYGNNQEMDAELDICPSGLQLTLINTRPSAMLTTLVTASL